MRAAAKVLDIDHLLERRPRELSGGQQQRVALGRALVRDPRVFLMDEPLSNLDAKLRVQMRSELKRFHQDLKATVIYVTHDQLEAVTMADKMAVMSGGVLQQYDSPEHVFDHPVNTFVAGFVGSPAMNLIALDVVANGTGADVAKQGWLELRALAGECAESGGSRPAVWCLAPGTARSPSTGRRSRERSRGGSTPSSRPAISPMRTSTSARRSIVVSVEPDVKLAPDDRVWLEFDQDKVHLFDGVAYLKGQSVKRPKFLTEFREVPQFYNIEDYSEAKRPVTRELPVEERVHNFEEVEAGLDEQKTREECKRCLRCDLEWLESMGLLKEAKKVA